MIPGVGITKRYQTLLQLLIEQQGYTGINRDDWSFVVRDEGRHWPSVNVAGHAVFEPVPGGADVDAWHRFRESMILSTEAYASYMGLLNAESEGAVFVSSETESFMLEPAAECTRIAANHGN